MGKKKRDTKNNTGSRTPTPEPEKAEAGSPVEVVPALPEKVEPEAPAEVAPAEVAPAQPEKAVVEAPAETAPAPPAAAAVEDPIETRGTSVQVLNDFALEVASGPESSPTSQSPKEPQLSNASVCPVFEETEANSVPTETGCLEANCSGCQVM